MIPLGVLGASRHVTAVGPGRVITDTFTRPDATGLGTTETGGATWVYGSGTSGTSVWMVTSGAAALSGPSGTHNVALVDVGSSDMEAEVTVTSAGALTRFPGMVARGTPGGASGYVLWLGTASVEVVCRLSTGEQIQLTKSGVARADGLRLRLRTVEEGGATRIIAHVDDVEIYNATDSLSTRPTGTHAGLFAYRSDCLLDDFQAEAL